MSLYHLHPEDAIPGFTRPIESLFEKRPEPERREMTPDEAAARAKSVRRFFGDPFEPAPPRRESSKGYEVPKFREW